MTADPVPSSNTQRLGASGRPASLELVKHHGLGNDFLIVHQADLTAVGMLDEEFAQLVEQLCDRRRGIGADGVMIVMAYDQLRSDGFDAQMVLHNADGSRAEMSGNGIRCFAHAIARRTASFDPQRILTDGGPRLVTLAPTPDEHTIDATVEMGQVSALDEPHDWATLGAHPDRPVAHLDLGNPHSVVGVDDVSEVDLESLGAKVPHVNLEIVQPGPEPNGITMRVHERGVGITEACGTGACASAWAAVQWGLVAASATEIVVHMDGGSATVKLNEAEPGSVTLTGPSTYIGKIEIELT